MDGKLETTDRTQVPDKTAKEAYSLLCSPCSRDVKVAAERLLRTLGGSKRFRGFDMVLDAVVMAYADAQLLQHVHTLYEAVALSTGRSWMCVERDMRYFVNNIWDEGERPELDRIAHRKLKQKPTNGLFLDILTYGLKEILADSQ